MTPEWLEAAYAEGVEDASTKVIIGIINGIYKYFPENYKELDEVFTNVDVKRLSPVCMISLIRTTFATKVLLLSWLDLLDRMRIELDRRNEDTEGMLGLDKIVLSKGELKAAEVRGIDTSHWFK